MDINGLFLHVIYMTQNYGNIGTFNHNI